MDTKLSVHFKVGECGANNSATVPHLVRFRILAANPSVQRLLLFDLSPRSSVVVFLKIFFPLLFRISDQESKMGGADRQGEFLPRNYSLSSPRHWRPG